MSRLIMQQSPSPVVSLVEHQLSCAVQDEVIVLNVNTGSFYNLNSSGAVIWGFLQQPRQIAEICEWVRSRYGCSASEVNRDVAQFLDEMQSVGLIAMTQGVGQQR